MKSGSVSELAHWNMQSFSWEVTFLCTSCSRFWEIHILRAKGQNFALWGEACWKRLFFALWGEACWRRLFFALWGELSGGGCSSPFGEKLSGGPAVRSESQSLMEVYNESALCYCLSPSVFPRSWTQRILRPCSCSPKITSRIGAIKPEP